MNNNIEELKAELVKVAGTMPVKRLAFSKGLAQGKSQGKAYSDAGYQSKKPHEDANKAIARYPNITQYKELFKKIAELEALPKEIASFEDKEQFLWDIAKEMFSNRPLDSEGLPLGADPASRRVAITAVAEMNKMRGHLAAIKQDIGLRGIDSLIDELQGNGDR